MISFYSYKNETTVLELYHDSLVVQMPGHLIAQRGV